MYGRPLTPVPFFPVSGHRGQCRPSWSCPSPACSLHRIHFSALWLTGVIEGAVVGPGIGSIETEDEARVVIEGWATVVKEFALEVEGEAVVEVQLDGWKGVGVVTL